MQPSPATSRCTWLPGSPTLATHPNKSAPTFTGTLLGDKAWSTAFDNSTIKGFVPGYQATIPFQQGIRRTLAGFDED